MRGGSAERATTYKSVGRNNRKEAKEAQGKNSGVLLAKAVKIVGLFFLVLSLYFLVAFTSYLFTWQIDHSYVSDSNGGWANLTKSREELEAMGADHQAVENWLGKFGALLAHQFIYKWFGIASFLFIALFFILGYRMLFKVKLIPLDRTFAYSFFLILYVSVTIGFFHGLVSGSPHFLEGEFGFWSNRLLQAQIGRPGVAGFLVFAGVTMLIVAFNIDFKAPQRKKKINLYQEDELVPVDEGDEDEVEEGETLAAADFHQNHLRPVPLAEQESEPAKDRLIHDLQVENEKARPKDNREKSNGPTFELEDTRIAPQEGLPEKDQTEQELRLEIDEPPKIEAPALTVEKIKEEKPLDKAASLVEEFGPYDPKLDLASYQYPPLDLLRDYGSGKIMVNNAELEANKDKIVETLANYNIEIDKIKATIGPTVTLYEIIPKPGVRISKIKNLEDDIALSLAALGIRIIAPMPGKGTIGIEVPNTKPEMVSMRSVIATEKFQHTDMDLPIALGKTISNEVYIADLAKMPHLLVAGATGQGKSVGINAILTSLLYKRHPAELKFVLVDPKKVELSLFKTIERHFLAKLPGEDDAIITDTKKVINTLNSLCVEMDQRYDLLKNGGVRNLKEYNVKFVNRRLNPEEGHRFLPFIVLIVDEFADLMMTAGKEVETPIARLAQLARAVGIHLVIATQRPSVNIITGTIKANFPARLAFRVLSKIDSRTILDSGGADQLIGRGDMLLATGSDLIRIQCAFVDTPEVEGISEFIGNQRGYASAFFLPEYVDENGEGNGLADVDLMNDRDSLFEEAARLIVLHQQGSTSLIQRKLKLGYNRAGRIIDQLEAAGIVGPFEGSKARDVLYPDEYSLEQYLQTLDNKGD